MKRVIIAIVGVFLALDLSAQPAKSRVAANNAKTTSKTTQSATQSVSRASIMFPTAVDVPQEVTWRRDIYRELDLTKDENAPLYYPVEPQDGRVNLFTLLFRLLNVGKIPAYNYDINGIENFNKDNRMHFKDMLDRYDIPYEVQGNSINVEQSDVPSSEVLSYYIKESSYYDQNTATYHSRVVALCPVIHRNDDLFALDASNASKSPLFWVKIEDIEPYLSQNMIMISNINNAANMSMADFFDTNRYKGTIYMTNNMQGKALVQATTSDSIFIDDKKFGIAKEQKRIEKEMSDFEKHIWTTPVDSVTMAKRDSIAAAETTAKKVKKISMRTSTARTTGSSKAEKTSTGSKSSGSAPRVSVRRTRH